MKYIFLTIFFHFHIDVIEKPITRMGDKPHQALVTGFIYLVCLAEVDDDGIFKICLDYWHFFTRELYTTDQILKVLLVVVMVQHLH